MLPGRLVRRPAAGVAATLAAVAWIASGCASPGSGIQAGEHVTVYVSSPFRGPQGSEGRDVADGARLALADAGGKLGELGVRARYLDDAGGDGANAGWSAAAAAANARRAAEDSTAIAFLGDFDSGATRFSVPITNQARMLQVSPASAAVDLVQPYVGAGDQIPEETQPTGERTFGRVIPSDEQQGKAAAAWAKRLGATRVATVSDGSAFGEVMVESFRAAAGGLVHGPPGDANLLYYGGTAGDVPAVVKRSLAADCPSPAVIGSDALFGSSLLRSVSPGNVICGSPPSSSDGVLLTSAAESPSQLPGSGQRFVRAFRARYGRHPGRYAAYGYEAMAVILDSIRRAGGSGDDRDAVVEAFFDTRDRDSVLGTYSIDEVGNTTLDRLAGYGVIAGRPVFATSLRAP
jgi:branched-chain amino acid transport system substrate-binding protein